MLNASCFEKGLDAQKRGKNRQHPAGQRTCPKDWRMSRAHATVASVTCVSPAQNLYCIASTRNCSKGTAGMNWKKLRYIQHFPEQNHPRIVLAKLCESVSHRESRMQRYGSLLCVVLFYLFKRDSVCCGTSACSSDEGLGTTTVNGNVPETGLPDFPCCFGVSMQHKGLIQ